MARWEGNARGRLEQAALALFGEQGYEHTTVAQIAQRANLTERTFYRWFSDKREVLFGASGDFEKQLVTAIEAVPADTAALPTLLAAFTTLPDAIHSREFLRELSAVIAASPALQERELTKQASVADAVAAALVGRGCDARTARLATDVGLAVLREVSQRWLAGEDMTEAYETTVADLLAVTADARMPRR